MELPEIRNHEVLEADDDNQANSDIANAASNQQSTTNNVESSILIEVEAVMQSNHTHYILLISG